MSNSFWDFSVETYGKPGVAEACLTLQNDHGVDVNLLLYCCWIGMTRGLLDRETFSNAQRYSDSWREHVVQPLRSARHWMKHTGCADGGVAEDACMALRERIKTIELQAERIQEETLESLSPSTPEQPLALASQIAAAAENVYRYLQAAKIVTDGRVMTQLGILLVAAMDGASDAMVEDALQGIRD